MIQKVIDGIITAIRTEYDSAHFKVYTELVEQGLRNPCFSVMCLNPSVEVIGKVRSRRYYPFVIDYFSKSDDEPVDECNTVYETLIECLSDITVEDKIIHGSNVSGNVVDGVLHFQITYDLFLLKKEELESMMQFEESTKVMERRITWQKKKKNQKRFYSQRNRL